jgi:hypothetical protein
MRLPSNALLLATLAAVLLSHTHAPAAPHRHAWLIAASTLVCLMLATATAWQAPRYDSGPLRRISPRAATALRRATLETDIRGYLRRRPTEATAWLALAWIKQEEASASSRLASWGERIDPTNGGVRTAARRLAR